MIRATIDHNVLVSGALQPAGSSGRILQAVLNRTIATVSSNFLAEELTEILNRPHLREQIERWQPVTAIADRILAAFEIVTPEHAITPVSRDPKDDPILEAALAGHVDFIVTGDKDLLDLGWCEDIPIIRPADFARLLSAN